MKSNSHKMMALAPALILAFSAQAQTTPGANGNALVPLPSTNLIYTTTGGGVYAPPAGGAAIVTPGMHYPGDPANQYLTQETISASPNGSISAGVTGVNRILGNGAEPARAYPGRTGVTFNPTTGAVLGHDGVYLGGPDATRAGALTGFAGPNGVAVMTPDSLGVYRYGPSGVAVSPSSGANASVGNVTTINQIPLASGTSVNLSSFAPNGVVTVATPGGSNLYANSSTPSTSSGASLGSGISGVATGYNLISSDFVRGGQTGYAVSPTGGALLTTPDTNNYGTLLSTGIGKVELTPAGANTVVPGTVAGPYAASQPLSASANSAGVQYGGVGGTGTFLYQTTGVPSSGVVNTDGTANLGLPGANSTLLGSTVVPSQATVSSDRVVTIPLPANSSLYHNQPAGVLQVGPNGVNLNGIIIPLPVPSL